MVTATPSSLFGSGLVFIFFSSDFFPVLTVFEGALVGLLFTTLVGALMRVVLGSSAFAVDGFLTPGLVVVILVVVLAAVVVVVDGRVVVVRALVVRVEETVRIGDFESEEVVLGTALVVAGFEAGGLVVADLPVNFAVMVDVLAVTLLGTVPIVVGFFTEVRVVVLLIPSGRVRAGTPVLGLVAAPLSTVFGLAVASLDSFLASNSRLLCAAASRFCASLTCFSSSFLFRSASCCSLRRFALAIFSSREALVVALDVEGLLLEPVGFLVPGDTDNLKDE